jgi:predicted enzyme related to lactoylglutathione lyase
MLNGQIHADSYDVGAEQARLFFFDGNDLEAELTRVENVGEVVPMESVEDEESFIVGYIDGLKDFLGLW